MHLFSGRRSEKIKLTLAFSLFFGFILYAKIQETDYGDSTATVKHYDIILNTYMRSGSTVTGKLLSKRTDVFYMFEPLWRVSKFNFYKGPHLFCEYLSPVCKNVTETSRHEIRPLRESLDFMRSILNCSFNLYAHYLIDLSFKEFQTETHDWNFHKYYGWEEYNKCKIDKSQTMDSCLAAAEPRCKKSKHRVMKVLRMTLDNLEPLLQENPNLKVVHLFRDPRGVINSHLHTGWIRVFEEDIDNVYDDIRVTCGRMLIDINIGKLFMEKYPDRVKLIRYEDFHNLGDRLKILYEFAGMSSDKESQRLIRRFGVEIKSKGSKGFHPDSYRITLSWKIIKMMDTECSEVLRQLGYTRYKDEQHLRDLDQPPIVSPQLFAT